mmetsp:Transcript_26547/g.36554  ORF Transcript_26547/g.36554 Transcript_26547/m.36554 type:complete len:300 (+) Transcript_26547:3062-3961(+)
MQRPTTPPSETASLAHTPFHCFFLCVRCCCLCSSSSLSKDSLYPPRSTGVGSCAGLVIVRARAAWARRSTWSPTRARCNATSSKASPRTTCYRIRSTRKPSPSPGNLLWRIRQCEACARSSPKRNTVLMRWMPRKWRGCRGRPFWRRAVTWVQSLTTTPRTRPTLTLTALTRRQPLTATDLYLLFAIVSSMPPSVATTIVPQYNRTKRVHYLMHYVLHTHKPALHHRIRNTPLHKIILPRTHLTRHHFVRDPTPLIAPEHPLHIITTITLSRTRPLGHHRAVHCPTTTYLNICNIIFYH